MIRLLTDLGTDAPYGSSLRISRTVRYHSVGATRQGRPSSGRPGGSFHRVRRRKIRSDFPDRFLLGKGVLSKDKVTAQLVHPHCLCHYAPVYRMSKNLLTHTFPNRLLAKFHQLCYTQHESIIYKWCWLLPSSQKYAVSLSSGLSR